MPTAAKLIAALWFAAVGWLAANAYVPQLGEGASPGYFREISAAVGLLCGWLVMGGSVGRGYPDAVGAGLKTAIILAFLVLLGFSTWQMVEASMRGHYGSSPMQAVLGIFEFMMENARLMVIPGVLGTLGLGGVVGGLAAEGAGRTWR